jgi:uncharacterized protein YukE
MDISVKVQDVEQFANQLNTWAQSMKSIRQTITVRVQQLENKWKDPQYRTFVETANNYSTQLGAAVNQFEEMSKNLKIMARALQQTQQEMQRRVRNMNQR